MTGPLQGVRVVDVSAVVSGPLATMMLADQGADVIKVEPLEIGDVTRLPVNYRDGMSALYANCNRGKGEAKSEVADHMVSIHIPTIW